MNAKLLSIITKKVWIIIALSLYFAKVFSYDFEVDGLCYNILSENQVEVTYKYVQGDYSGKLVIPEKVKYGGKEYIVSVIGTDAFSWCSGLTGSLVIPNSVTRIGYRAFFNCSGLTGSLTIPNSVTSIGAQAFDGCSSLTGSLIIPNSVTTIMHRSFRGCKFTGSLTIPNSITTIEEHVFDGCSGFTGSLIIPSSVTSIDDGAFNGCSGFTGSLIIPSTVTSIGSSTFYGCSGLTSLIIPSSVASIGYKTFMYCKRLSYVESQMEFPFSFGDDIFLGIASNAILVIPKGESYPYGITKWFAETKRKSDNYILSISSSGNGYASYDGTSIRTKTEEFSLTEGATATITFTPDEGYRIKTVKVNNSTVSVSNNQYTISSINANTTVSVEFEAIPPTTYTLSVTASGNGSATYGSTTIRNNTRSFTVNEGTTATITFTPDDGYRIKTVKVNNSNVSVSNNQYTISSINANTTISVEFEAIPPTTYTLSVTASGNGSATYGSTAIRNNTRNYTVNEGASATITFIPDDGYRIKSVKVNNYTVSVSNNQYTINSINANTTVSVEFEAIPAVTYSLSITASGNGSVTYNTSTIRNDSRGYILNEGTSVSVSFTPDEGYQVKSVRVNGSMVSAPTNSYYISSITRNTTIEVEFEEIPINSESWYNTYITCINRTESKIVTGSNVQKTVGFEIANSGNRSVYVTKLVARHPDTNATLTTSTDMSLLGELKPDSTKALSISLRVDVSPIYEITYTVDSEEYLYDNTQYFILSIKGNKFGVVKFMEASVGVDLKKFSIKPGDNATIEFVPNNGCVLTKATVKDTDITSNIVGSKYTIANITSSTSVNAVFDGVSGDSRSINGHEYVDLGLPSGKYWSTVNYGAKNPEDAGSYSSVHNLGTVSSEWGEYWISPTKDDMQELLDMCEWNWSELNGKKGFIIKGPNGNTMFLPAAGMHYSTYYSSVGTLAYYCTSTHDDYSRYCVFKGDTSEKEFMLESGLLNQYSVRPISTVKNESVFSVDGLHFTVVSADDKTVNLAKGNYGKVLEVPATVKYPSTEWKIVGIDNDALSECNELAAIIWDPDAAFTESVDNPNLLLYVKSADYAPTTIKNVVVNGVADRITLTDASGKNDFYCPQEFTAKEVSYTHNYKMETGLGNARGWETIALPFDVQKVTHESKGEIIPFANWKSGDTKKPFWLMTYGANGWTEATNIKANTPYIISMPNHSDYKSEFRLNGRVTFSAENVTMPTSDNLNTTAYNGKTFIPNYTNQSNKNFYALNVNNDLETFSGSDVEGSIFLIGDMVDRVIHPFEAYMTSVSQTRGYIAIDEDLATSIGDISEISAEESPLLYNIFSSLRYREPEVQSVERSLCQCYLPL